MRVVQTNKITPETLPTTETERLWVYNGLDCMVTLDVFDGLREGASNTVLNTYEFSKSLLAPVMEINMHGLRVDLEDREREVAMLDKDIKRLEEQLDIIFRDGFGLYDINWRSPKQMIEFFYGFLKLPEIKKRNTKGEYVPTVDRDALEALTVHFYAEPVINHLLLMRDLAKKKSTLETDIDADNRLRTSINIAGTSTGRFSSSFSELGTGGNLQNVEERLRRIFTPDKGMKFAYVDLEQAESRAVGAIEWNLFKDGRYLDACESGDLHTSVCKLAWPALPWIGDLRLDKEVAETPFYRQHSHRHMAKVLGHGTNYAGQPWTMAKHTKLEQGIIKEFQGKYFAAFPAHKQWHERVRETIRTEGKITTFMGRLRHFWGRRTDDSTVREAIAYEPQSAVADILNRGMLNVWRLGICQLMLQIHDAILIQYPEDQEDIILPQVLKAIQVPVELFHNRTLLIPSEAKVGWNWGNQGFNKETKEVINPWGLVKYKGEGSDKRKRPAKV